MIPQDIYELLQQFKKRLDEIDKKIELLEPANPLFKEWIPLQRVMKFLNYRPTRMASFIKENKLVTTKVGNRKFIHENSLRAILEKNINH